MSKALRCDRCKFCFDPYAVQGDREFATIFGFCYQNGEQFDLNECGYREIENVHLCPDCAKRFASFMAREDSDPDICQDKGSKAAYDRGFQNGFRYALRKIDKAPNEKNRSV